jgi:plastocyanin
MRVVHKFAALTLFVWPAVAGDVSIYLHITKRLTKRVVAATVYDLRGAAPTLAAAEPSGNEFDRTVVVLEGKTPVPAEPRTITVEQRDSHFDPDLVVVPAGSTVRFPNSDPVFHNVFSLSRTQPFDLGFYPKSQSRSVKFDHAGIVQVYCHIHANMYAAIVVTDSPWYGKPGEDGVVLLKDVAAGHYRAEAWHKIAGLYSTEVDVPAVGKARADIQIPLNAEHKP